jgi:ribosomal-protein-serine acetyltransferase
MPQFPLGDGRCLRPLEEADADELHQLVERNRPRLAQWIAWAREQTLEDTIAFIGRARALEVEDSGLSRGIVDDGRLVGVVGITVDEANHSAEIGYWLDEAACGKGIATAAVATIVDFGFDRWQLMRVEIRADVENRPSCAVAERLGFLFEGVMRQAYLVGERYSDDALYSMLSSDPARARLSSAGRRSAAAEPAGEEADADDARDATLRGADR